MNTLIHLDHVSPYIRYVNDYTKQGYFDFNERIIYDNEIYFCVDGEAKMYMEGEVFTISRGDVFFLRPGLKNRMVVEKNKSIRMHCVHFDWHYTEEPLNFSAEEVYIFPETPEIRLLKEKLKERPNAEIAELSFPSLVRGTDYERTLPLFRGMYNAYRDGSAAASFRLRGLFMQAISEIMLARDLNNSSTEQTHRQIANKAIRYIIEHYNEEITVPMLARITGMSNKYFGVIFKRVTGITVNEYILKIRMEKTEEMLRTTQLSLQEIAYAVGIGDEYYIVKLFKKYKGITPGRYRRMLTYLGGSAPGNEN